MQQNYAETKSTQKCLCTLGMQGENVYTFAVLVYHIYKCKENVYHIFCYG